ncbi:MAG: hypothetical protein CL908_15230 [Deltaproteobacteria bacterium]|jgi:hypothetical protein|nr:hypothetical protein [Deltaproteobacteria bacterium]
MEMAATEMNATTPMPNKRSFGLQIEGLMAALLYLICFGWTHLAAVGTGATQTLLSAKLLAVFLAGMIAIPLVTLLPLVGLRRVLAGVLSRGSAIGAAAPLAQVALYGLQCLLLWIITREVYAWLFAQPIAV